jgi:hypothetical protein
MNRLTISMLTILLLTGCTSQQIDQMQRDEQSAEQLYTATTRATASARQSLATMPSNSPGRDQSLKVVTAAEKGEQTARLALDVAKAALDAAQKKDAADPALAAAVSRAVGAIPSPWAAVLASLLPAAIPLAVSVIQSVKLGRANQTVAHVTQQLQEHKAALEAITPSAPSLAPTSSLPPRG